MNECRRCSDCKGCEHHWLPNPDFGNGDDEDPNPECGLTPTQPDYAYICKHCPALGGECPDCEGAGIPDDEDDEFDEDQFFENCETCGGSGVVQGLAYTGWRE